MIAFLRALLALLFLVLWLTVGIWWAVGVVIVAVLVLEGTLL